MPGVTAALRIDRPIGDVYAAVADYRTRIRLLPDNFTNVRLLTDADADPGARFAFTIHTDRGAYVSVTEMTAAEPPHHIAERTTSDDGAYETHWRFAPDGAETAVSLETRYIAPGGWLAGLLDRLFGQRALRHSLLVELVRLKQVLETP